MNYAEFRKSLCRAMWIQDAMITIEANTNMIAIPHKHTLFVDDEWGIEAPGCDLHLEWKTIEKMVEEGRWENYQRGTSTIMIVDGMEYRIKFHRPTSLEELI